MSFDTSLFLYNVSLKKSSSSVCSIVGQFSGRKSQEILIAKSTFLELWNMDPETGKLIKIFSQDCFSTIRTMVAFRIPGSLKDHVAVTSDSGNIVVLELDIDYKKFIAVQQEPYGKTGIRRVVPGEFICSDSKGRAIMISAIEKNKLVYVMKRDNVNNVTISSPLEAHRSKVITFFSVGLDVGYENPLFATIEIDYSEFEYAEFDVDNTPLSLTYYELDLGLNHVVKKWTESIPASSNHLISVPGGNDGPSGLLVCSKNLIAYKNINRPDHYIPIPKRANQIVDSQIITSVVHKMKGVFFIIAQTNLGDLFKITIDHADDVVSAIQIKYFDTIPLCKRLLILKKGFLFADCEAGNKLFYQFQKLGDDDEEKVFVSSDYPDDLAVIEEEEAFFKTKELDNLALVDIIETLDPVLNSKLIQNSGDETSQIYALSGQGSRSALKILEHGLSVNEVVASELPAHATSVFTTKLAATDEFDRYLVISFPDGTLVLSIGEVVEEVTDSGLTLTEPTITVQQLGLSSLVQVYPNGVRHLDKYGKSTEWLPPAGIKIVKSSTTNYQVAIALSNRELVYFEIDDDDQLIEYNERREMSGQITSLSLGDIPTGKLRSPFLVVGCNDLSIQVISVDPTSTLEVISTQFLSAIPTDLLIMRMKDSTLTSIDLSTLYIHIGMESGVYVRTTLDQITGQLSDTIIRYLGSKPVKLSKVKIVDQDAVLALSSNSWVGYTHGADFKMTPLSYPTLDHGYNFSSEDCPIGIVGVHKNNLTIFTIDQISENLRLDSVPLRYTPRDLAYADPNILYIIGADYNVKAPYLEDESDPEFFEAFGYDREKGKWGSCIQVYDSSGREIIQNIELQENENAVSITTCFFKSHEESFLIVATNKGQQYLPNTKESSFIYSYKIKNGGKSLEFYHKSEIEDAPLSMIEFQGKLLVGVTDTLRLYDMGQRQLLKKSSTKINVDQIVKLSSHGNRVVVGDIKNSVTFTVYKEAENRFFPFADDIISRHITAMKMIDYDTVVGGDKFGNLWVLRCPEVASKISDEDEHGTFLAVQDTFLNGAPYRLDPLCHFYLDDIPTSFHKGTLVASGREAVVYSGLQGTIGLLIPIVSRQEIDFFVKLEGLLREHDKSLFGRDHLVWRSYYVPVKGVIDGDFVEKYSSLPNSLKLKIANSLDVAPKDVERKINDMRTRSAF